MRGRGLLGPGDLPTPKNGNRRDLYRGKVPRLPIGQAGRDSRGLRERPQASGRRLVKILLRIARREPLSTEEEELGCIVRILPRRRSRRGSLRPRTGKGRHRMSQTEQGRGGRPKTPPAITSLSVSGFKSIVEEQTLEIRPFALLAGANSSGKSSMVQPLLLLKQTLEAPYNPALLLDGPMLGSISSINSGPCRPARGLKVRDHAWDIHGQNSRSPSVEAKRVTSSMSNVTAFSLMIEKLISRGLLLQKRS